MDYISKYIILNNTRYLINFFPNEGDSKNCINWVLYNENYNNGII